MRNECVVPFIVALISLTGCISSPTLYPGTGQTPDLRELGVTVLGEITVCQGAWCKKDDGGYESQLSLPAPPPAYTYHSALAKKAAKHEIQVSEHPRLCSARFISGYPERDVRRILRQGLRGQRRSDMFERSTLCSHP